MNDEKVILISACLLGDICRYDGKKLPSLPEEIQKKLKSYKLIKVCPERDGGLPVPRDPAEIESGKTANEVLKRKGRILSAKGEDLTGFFLEGIKKSMNEINPEKIQGAILKDKSPSCGSQFIYDGRFRGTLIRGKGVFCAFLENNNIRVVSDKKQELDAFLNKKITKR